MSWSALFGFCQPFFAVKEVVKNDYFYHIKKSEMLLLVKDKKKEIQTEITVEQVYEACSTI